MTKSEPFNFVINKEKTDQLFDEYHDLTSAPGHSIDIQILSELRKQHPELIVSTVPASNCNLTQFALAGHAAIELDLETDNIVRYRGFVPATKRGHKGDLADAINFAKFTYVWQDTAFILYTVGSGIYATQFILADPCRDEKPLGHSAVTDALLRAIGDWASSDRDVVYVFDGSWQKSRNLWTEVQKAEWDDVILDPGMKNELIEVASKFFDSEDIYKQFGVPWKRGLIFYGPVGNGKTISIKALMHSLYKRKDPIPSLYVKSAYGPYQVRSIFVMARNMAPCMLVMEDLETIVYGASRSYFFNEVDGLENNNGILMVGSTNYLNRLDPGITKRPSRFDRKYLFPLPSNEEREQYCRYWRKKILKNPKVDYPKKLVKLIAAITFGFSFAYLQEAFVATLLELVRQQAIDLGDTIKEITETDFDDCDHDCEHEHEEDDGDDSDDDDDDIDKIPFWRVIRQQVSILRDDISRSSTSSEDESQMGLLSTGKKYWDSVLGGLYQMFGGDGGASGATAGAAIVTADDSMRVGGGLFPEMVPSTGRSPQQQHGMAYRAGLPNLSRMDNN